MGAMETEPLTDEQLQRQEALVGRLFEAGVGAFDLLVVYLGDRLGLYRALQEGGPANSTELAARTGTDERYVREWLEHQGVSGVLTVDDNDSDPATRAYGLPPEYSAVFLEEESPSYIAPMARYLPPIGGMMRPLLEAFRTGAGVPYRDFGADAREAQAAFNRPMLTQLFAKEWLPTVADVHARLQADPPARVADIACGGGWSSVAIAKAYPKVSVDGFDLDEESVELARSNADEAGLSDRVRFLVQDASDPALKGGYDLVIMVEALHDLGRPVAALQVMKGLAGDQGTVIILDEAVEDEFRAPTENPVERFMYGASVLFCLPTGRADGPEPHGTVLRAAQLKQYAARAGFADVEVLPFDYPFLRPYRLHQ